MPDGRGFKVRESRKLLFWQTYPDAIPDGVLVCKCAQQRQNEKLWGNSGVPPKRTHCTFEGFDSFPDNLKYKKEQARFYAGAMAERQRLIVDGVEKISMTFSGRTGLGKSGLMAAVAMEWMRQGIAILWVDFGEFMEAIHKSYENDSDLATSTVVESAQRAPLLCLDDLGDMNRISPVTDHTREKTYALIRYRYEQMLPTIITTNLTVPQLLTQFGPRITERIGEMSHWIEMAGESLRFG